jgi:hypothetical protein
MWRLPGSKLVVSCTCLGLPVCIVERLNEHRLVASFTECIGAMV